MAKYTKALTGDFDQIIKKIERGILEGSVSASLEDSYDYNNGKTRCAVRVFERYSYSGSNRVSMSVTLFCDETNVIQLCAITSGGSQAMFFKMNTFGEDNFLYKLKEII